MHPLGSDVIVRPLYDPDTVETGLSPGAPALYMPDSGKNPMSQQGIVHSVGPEQKVIWVGDHILYHPFVQHPFQYDGREYLHVKARYIAGLLSKSGELIPLPWDVVIRPDFPEVGRPIQHGKLWLPGTAHDDAVPCTGVVESIGERVESVRVGSRVLFPAEAGDEIGLKKVYYTIPEREILAILGTELPVTVMATVNWRRSHA